MQNERFFTRELGLSFPKNLVLLFIRLLIAYGFATPAIVKISDLNGAIEWFQGLSVPFPIETAYLITIIEAVAILLLVLGLFARFASLLLILIMIGAIIFVHASNGFAAENNGVEVPLLYIALLLVIVTQGAGKYSLNQLLFGEEDE